MLSIGAGSSDGRGQHPLKGKKVYIPPWRTAAAGPSPAAFRAIGVEADIVPLSDERTREVGARYTSGDECYPAKVTIGDFMKLLESPDIDPDKILLFMPTADGPCRFGQYAPYLKQILTATATTRPRLSPRRATTLTAAG